ncbi:hypothetical protein NMY22_g8355 [Coprinellus aureogranulatus]|nr:hypothetical protein NMY22_g8355 [Coprinellus aureogranulatus]
MGVEDPNSATPTGTPINSNQPKLPDSRTLNAPKSAVPIARSKLSITSPVFKPTWEAGSNNSTAVADAPVETGNGEAVEAKA